MKEMKQGPKTSEFRVGSLVKLKDNLSVMTYKTLSREFKKGEVYKVIRLDIIRNEDSKSKDSVVAWLGPSDMTEQEILEFESALEQGHHIEKMFPVAVSHLRPVYH